eukprot:TRINITY_DN33143_c0_g1_i1.p1 TRINITY_DN33143_c0_g1~~TRINITY_DN33143_c0_g1_i1.p1  ORF type:complete len:304 (+),score=29.16 TRINITY_DN33143_c0_g1_i1:28-912(+)
MPASGNKQNKQKNLKKTEYKARSQAEEGRGSTAMSSDEEPQWVSGAVCYALFKPRNLLTSNKPNPGVVGRIEHRRGCMGEWLKEVAAAHPVDRLFHVGRLDRKTSGLLLATNCGPLSSYVCCPGRLEKEYIVTSQQRPPPDAIERMLAGLELHDGFARALEAEVISLEEQQIELPVSATKKRKLRESGDGKGAGPPKGPESEDKPERITRTKVSVKVRVVVNIGRNHIVKRLCHAVGIHVTGLHRSRIGPFSLSAAGLKEEGEQVLVTADQLRTLYRAGIGRGEEAANGEDVED